MDAARDAGRTIGGVGDLVAFYSRLAATTAPLPAAVQAGAVRQLLGDERVVARDTCRALARRADADGDTLAALTRHPAVVVRVDALTNPNCPTGAAAQAGSSNAPSTCGAGPVTRTARAVFVSGTWGGPSSTSIRQG